MNEIRPQPGFQEKFLSTSADIAIGGGAAGASKSFGLLLEATRHVQNPGWGPVIFRRTMPQIKNEGALWDTSKKIMPHFNGQPRDVKADWLFPSGAKISFKSLQYDNSVDEWQGTQIPLIGFDELTHFTRRQFFTMLSRNRSECGVSPYIRATCNPDSDSWVRDFIDWWIGEDGFPIAERDGVLRYMVVDGDTVLWGKTAEEAKAKAPHLYIDPKTPDPISVTFIHGTIDDNQILQNLDPSYKAKLMALPAEQRAALLDGNWNKTAGSNRMADNDAVRDALSNAFIPYGKRAITADIALQGSDWFVICVWDGWHLIDIYIEEKSEANEIERKIKEYAERYSVPRSRIVYDADGVGNYVGSYVKGAKGFHGNAQAIKVKGQAQDYKNLKAQCAYILAQQFNDRAIYIKPEVADRKFKDRTIAKLVEIQMRCLQRDKPDHDGKLQIIGKHLMKAINAGMSPDILDALLMRSLLDLLPSGTSTYGSL